MMSNKTAARCVLVPGGPLGHALMYDATFWAFYKGENRNVSVTLLTSNIAIKRYHWYTSGFLTVENQLKGRV